MTDSVMPDPPAPKALEPAARRGGRKWWLVAAGVALFGVALWRVGIGKIAAELSHVGYRAVFLVVPYAIGTTIGAWPWAKLLPREARPRARGVVAGRFVASSANAFLPFFGLAGEPARLLWLRREHRAQGLAAIVVDRVLYNTSNGLLLASGALVALLATSLPAGVPLGAAAAAVAMLAVPLGMLFFVLRFGIGKHVQALVRRMLGAAYSDGGFGDEVDRSLLAIVRAPPSRLAAGVVTHVLGRASIATEVYLGLVLLGARFTLADAVVLAVVPIGLSLVFSSIPSQIGVQEGGQALIAGALGLSPTLGVALVLLQRFRQVVSAAFVPLLLRDAKPPGGEADVRLP
jgi:hypothetical protein